VEHEASDAKGPLGGISEHVDHNENEHQASLETDDVNAESSTSAISARNASTSDSS
jgi:hypothetical protein